MTSTTAIIEEEPVCEDAPGSHAAPVGHQEESIGHLNGQGHQHDSTGYLNGQGHQKFHGDEHCPHDDDVTETAAYNDPPEQVCEDAPGSHAAPVGHQEDSIGHLNGQGHQHDSTGYLNGQGHQKFHGEDDCHDEEQDLLDALFTLPPLDESLPGDDEPDTYEEEGFDIFA